MIVKRIPAMPSKRNKGGLRARHAQQLVDYLRLPEKDDPYRDHLIAYMASQKLPDMDAERLLHIGARNFVAKTLDGQRYEMMATAQGAVRSPNPVDHWLLSWREGEFPSHDEVDAVVAMFLGDLGLADAQCVYALHGDTHNRHVHMAVNRYDPVAGRVIEINGGFNLEAAHRAVARIVDRFGWAAEKNARYVMVDGVPLPSAIARERRARGEVALEPGARAFEVRTGYRSAQRLAQDIALPIIDRAISWADLHTRLAEAGIAFEQKKRGAVLMVGGEQVKASSLSRRTSLNKLVGRFGPFEARSNDVLIDSRDRRADLLPQAHRADEYRKVRDRHVQRTAPATLAGKRWHGIKPPPRDLESFLLEHGETYYAARWAGRAVPDPDRLAGGIVPDWRQPERIGRYEAYRMPDGVRYAAPDEPTAFVDRGVAVEVPPGSDEALLAAMRLSVAKFGRFKAEGSEQFVERVAALAVRHGMAKHVEGLVALRSTTAPAGGADQETPARANQPPAAVERTFDTSRRQTPRRPPAVPVQLPPDAVRAKGPMPVGRGAARERDVAQGRAETAMSVRQTAKPTALPVDVVLPTKGPKSRADGASPPDRTGKESGR